MASLNLYNYEPKYIANLIRTDNLSGRRFHSTCQFINEFKTSNDAGEFRQAFFPIYWTELVLKVKCNGSHASFLDLDISIDNINPFIRCLTNELPLTAVVLECLKLC